MHVNLVYKTYDAQQQEITKKIKTIVLNLLYLKEKKKGNKICKLNLNLET